MSIVLCRVLVCTCLLASVASTLRSYPHQLAYFNENAGGPANGWRHLIGSSFDWGQDCLPVTPGFTDAENVGKTFCTQIVAPRVRPIAWSSGKKLAPEERNCQLVSREFYAYLSLHDRSLILNYSTFSELMRAKKQLGSVLVTPVVELYCDKTIMSLAEISVRENSE